MAAKSKQPKPTTRKQAEAEERRVRILVSSAVIGYEDLLEIIYSTLEGFGYEVLMSYKGTLPINPDISAMKSCLKEVEECDVFLGVILPRYGSGEEEGSPHSITHLEAMKAIELNKPRWFLVHEHVAIARQLLMPYREGKAPDPWKLRSGMTFERTKILPDLRLLDLFELAMRHDIPMVKDREGNWVQAFGTDEDARLFAWAQFRRYREMEKRYLPRISDPEATSKKGGKR